VNGTAQAGLAVLSLVFVAAIFFIRYAVTPAPEPGRHRPQRVRRVEEYVPAYLLVPAQQLSAPCPDCGNHVTIHTTTGSTT
jgi:hypothetical protein